MTDDELMNLAEDLGQLSPQAREMLAAELSKRGISHGKIHVYAAERSNKSAEEKTSRAKRMYVLFPSLRGVGETLKDWNKYHREAGEWPRRSIAFYFIHLAAELSALFLILWWMLPHWSMGKFIALLIPLITLDVFLSDRIQRRIRLSEIAQHRHKESIKSITFSH